MAGSPVGAHAVVVGASMAGLTAASVLAGAYERVTVLDRDAAAEGVAPRRGVSQGRHPHALLAAGGDALDELFPGLIGELVAAGATFSDPGAHGRWCVNGYRLARGPLGRQVVLATRPFIEAHVRRRVQDRSAVSFVGRCDVRGLRTDTDGRVVGVRVRHRDGDGAEEDLAADLVVDCSGRRSATPAWLEALGYGRPAVEQLHLDVRYSTRRYRLPPDALGGDIVIFVGPTRRGPRGGLLMRVEQDWIVTLAAMGGYRPSTDPDRYAQFATRFPISDLADALARGEPLDDPVGYHYPASRRHRYDRLRSLPDGLLVAGDAVCSFNPIYGQGMTVAALEALALRAFLDEGGPPAPERWFAAATAIAAVPWDLAIVADLGVDCIQGQRSPRTRLVNAYLDRFHAAAAHDPALGAQFARVAGLVETPSRLVHPVTLARVVRGNLRRRRHRSG